MGNVAFAPTPTRPRWGREPDSSPWLMMRRLLVPAGSSTEMLWLQVMLPLVVR
ncbi:hypothetical protein [Candidatus Oscillochloris fontis]|uniref:hypothetical protein n=1 Tax=Candidatus Oscillochloris fontis TaxID=2496868 RepID=UPI0013757D54|nr:hypothetical protein [Candidatus Oscillochloris fontis]